MPIKILIKDAVKRYGATERTIRRYINKYEIHRFADSTYDQDQLDALFDNYVKYGYRDVDWDRAECKELPTNFFYRIEEKETNKNLDVQVFRAICTPCPIWKQCLGYATDNEEYGVWGGMTTHERVAVKDWSNSQLKDKVIKDFAEFGVSKKQIYEAIGKL